MGACGVNHQTRRTQEECSICTPGGRQTLSSKANEWWSKTQEDLLSVAGSDTVDPRRIEGLINHENMGVRASALKNPRLPLRAMTDAARSNYAQTREMVASNIGIPGWLAQELSENDDVDVRANALSNPVIPADTLHGAVLDGDMEDRISAAYNPALTSADAEFLAELEVKSIDTGLCSNPGVGDELLGRVSQRYPDGDDDLKVEAINRISEKFGINSEDALRSLLDQPWWELEDDSHEVFIARTMFQEDER